MPYDPHAKPAPMAVVLRSADPESKKYITGLPGTLEALLLKARSLFPVPPGHNPYITLDQGDDQAVVLLEDALPYLRDREGLVFRWSPDTPRKCTGNRVKWDESVAGSSKSNTSSSTASQPSGSSSSARAESSSTAAPQASSSGLSPPKAVSPTQHRTQAQQHRAAHAKRVLEEQRRIMEEERLEREEAAAVEQREAEEREQLQQQKQKEDIEKQEKEAEARAVAEGKSQIEALKQQQEGEQEAGKEEETAKTSSSQGTEVADATLQQPVVEAAEQQEESQEPRSTTISEEQQPDVSQAAQVKRTEASSQDFLLPGSSPPPYSSPHAPRADVLREVTPPSGRQDEQDMSSPLAPSPTREVYAAVAKASMSPHSDKLVAGSSPRVSASEVEQPQPQATSFTPSKARPQDAAADDDDDDEEMGSDAELENSALLQSSSSESSTPSPQKSDREQQQQDVDGFYTTMGLIVAEICNHPASSAFRGPMPAELDAHARSKTSSSAPFVDLPIIRFKVAQREYGNSSTTSSPLVALQSDLKRLFGLARSFYGPRSPQGQSATVLEKFAQVLIAAYNVRPASGPRTSSVLAQRKTPISTDNSSNRTKLVKADDKEESRRKAAALMASWQSGPATSARGEKRPYPQDGTSQSKQGRGRPSQKQAKLTFGPREKASSARVAEAVDMAAFHRAIMGTDRLPSSLARTPLADQLPAAAVATNTAPASRQEDSQPAVPPQAVEQPSDPVDETMQPIGPLEPEVPSRMTTRQSTSKEASRSEDEAPSNVNPRQQQQKTSTPSLRPRRRGLGSLATAAAVAGTAFISSATAAWTGTTS